MGELGLKFMGKNPLGEASPPNVDKDSDLNVTSRTVSGRLVKEAGIFLPEVTIDVEKYNTLALNIKGNVATIDIRGRKEDSDDWEPIKPITEKLFLLDDRIEEEGKYYFDLCFYNEVSIRAGSTTLSDYTADYVLLQHPCPKPVDAQMKFIRLTPEDGHVEGRFRAIEPLTDITLHNITRFYLRGSRPFETGDKRLAGHTIFGVFDRVRITEGVALLVEV